MDPQQLIYLLTALVVLGVGAQWLAARLHVPALILLLLTGLCLGPISELVLGSRILDPDAVFGDLLSPIISLSVALVLFEGGLTLDLDEARKAGRTLWLLILAGLFIGFAVVTLMARFVGGLDLVTSATLGAILVVTGPTVILPMLRSARIAWRPATLLKWEGIVNDPFGAILAFFVFALATQAGATGGSAWAIGIELLLDIVLAAGLGLGLAWLLHLALKHELVPEHLKNPVTLAMTLLAFALGEVVGHELGLISVTLLGIGLANTGHHGLERIRWFKEQIAHLLVALLFLVLSARLELRDLGRLEPRHLLLLGGILFVSRPLVVWLATLRSGLPWQERLLIGWIAPRGVVAAAVAGAFSVELRRAEFVDSDLLVPIVFGVILTTVTLNGLTIRPLATRLGLATSTGKGLLVVGASNWTTQLAEALVKAGALVILADTRYHRVARARMKGLEVHYGDVLADDLALDLPLERLSQVLVATEDDHYNALVCTHFRNAFGSEALYQLSPEKEPESRAHFGRTPWGEDGTFKRLARRFWAGGEFKVTNINEAYDAGRFRADNPEALPLFAIGERSLRLLEPGAEVPANVKLVYQAAPA
ncbi:MAG: cation:proton antiporter [Planctomycetota bacterium]